MPTETPLQRLASRVLGQPVAPWIRAQRPETSWRKIAAELNRVTHGEIDVPAQTLANWAPDPVVADEPSAAAS
ncbi:hypothetical protein [Pseudonocardia sp. N23]|uniref:hypothetical protein n=1 Tax=Pseudonocardia sp. N23 TaxID=1987376 RepID=UPI000BFC7BEA|nr:hypothetical protein [Pseudonocardia sp. N23]GAY12073.1 hypothetical protein TOK_0463 [Pseudonocardia sp. N23]